MSTAAIIAIAIGVVVVLGALSFVTLARRSDVRGAGALSGETRKRDRAAREAQPQEAVAAAPTRATVEAQGEIARYGTVLAPVEETALAPWAPPDEEALGVSRRQFFNRATVALTSAGVGGFFAAGFVAFLWPTATGGFGQAVTVGKLDDILDTIRSGDGFFYAPAARTWITEYPADAVPAAARCISPTSSPAWSRASSPSTRSARTSVVASRAAPRASGSSARATARSTTASVRRRPARRLVGWIVSP